MRSRRGHALEALARQLFNLLEDEPPLAPHPQQVRQSLFRPAGLIFDMQDAYEASNTIHLPREDVVWKVRSTAQSSQPAQRGGEQQPESEPPESDRGPFFIFAEETQDEIYDA